MASLWERFRGKRADRPSALGMSDAPDSPRQEEEEQQWHRPFAETDFQGLHQRMMQQPEDPAPLPDFRLEPEETPEQTQERDYLARLRQHIDAMEDPSKIKMVREFNEDMQEATAKAREFMRGFEKEESKLALQEVVERISHAAAQLGAAAAAGDKYDASGLKFDKTDWERRADRLNKRFEQAVQMIERNDREEARITEKEQDVRRRAAQERVQAEAQLAGLEQRKSEAEAQRAERERVAQERAEAAQAKLAARVSEADAKAVQKARENMLRIAGSKQTRNQKAASLRDIMVQDLGIPLEEANDMVRSGWLHRAHKKPEDIIKEFTDKLAQPQTGVTPAPTQAPAAGVRGQMTPADQQALQWAQANQGDPRAQRIMQRLRQEGKL